MPCNVVPPGDIKVVEVPIEDQGLQISVCFWLSLQGLSTICLFFKVRQPTVDAYYQITTIGLTFNPYL